MLRVFLILDNGKNTIVNEESQSKQSRESRECGLEL
jgi:hypothetical protein